MKKIFLLLMIIFALPMVISWDDCSTGITNCSYPGICGSYTDSNKDSICDHSQEEPQLTREELDDLITGNDLKEKTVKEVANIYKIDPNIFSNELSNYLDKKIEPDNTFQLLHDNYGLEPTIAKEIAINLSYGDKIFIEEVATSSEKDYYLLKISIVTILIYLFSWVLAKKNIISMIKHKKIWNMFLLVSFLISGILGILLVIRIEWGITFGSIPFNMLFWHVEAGIVMSIISIFHILWHISYFKSYLRKLK
ncbi:MAG: hypothetical protein WC867_01240 [Candidatus Pacearchaeota archaeon]|jgi:hypothetical protein